MPVTEEYRTYVLDQLGRVVRDVRSKRMFGGVGVYAGELFFALIDDDTLYFKVDDTNRGDFEERGCGPFQPTGPGGETMQYYRVPEELVEDADELRGWVEKAVEVARRAKQRPARSKPRGRK
jgi:DNA transformation protein